MGDLQTRRGEWLLRVAQWRESGLSQSAFCRLHHLKLATLSYWIARSNKSTSTAQEQPLTLVAAQWPKSGNCQTSCRLNRLIFMPFFALLFSLQHPSPLPVIFLD